MYKNIKLNLFVILLFSFITSMFAMKKSQEVPFCVSFVTTSDFTREFVEAVCCANMQKKGKCMEDCNEPDGNVERNRDKEKPVDFMISQQCCDKE